MKTLTITIFSIQYHGYKIHTRYSTVIIIPRYHKTKFPLSFQKIIRNAISTKLNAMNNTYKLNGIQEATEIKILNSAQRLRVATNEHQQYSMLIGRRTPASCAHAAQCNSTNAVLNEVFCTNLIITDNKIT